MKKAWIVLGLAALLGGGYYLLGGSRASSATPGGPGGAPGAARGGSGGGPGGMPGGGGGAFVRQSMTVEVATVTRAGIAEELTVVGNLIGLATVDVAPKVAGRLQSVDVRLGDRVARGQLLARIENNEIAQQVRQAEASYEVARATIRQREADLELARTSVERSRNLFGRQLLPQQTLDDAEARFQAATAQLDLARAQFEQSNARLEELRINLGNTRIASPVDGFVGARNLDQGAYASPNQPVVSVVDIHIVRLVVNLVEKDLRRVAAGTPARVDVDAFPGETFQGRVARVAPVLDPQTRTAQIEVEIANPTYRLKPGMYARVALEVGQRTDALVVPRAALVDLGGRRGVFQPQKDRAIFHVVEVGLEDEVRAEILKGLDEGATVVTTGAAALRDGDPIAIAGQGGRDGSPGAARAGASGSGGGPAGPGARATPPQPTGARR
jgi:HlyD family secretion protein